MLLGVYTYFYFAKTNVAIRSRDVMISRDLRSWRHIWPTTLCWFSASSAGALRSPCPGESHRLPFAWNQLEPN